MRRATDDDPGQRHGYRISIHALHEESDMLRESEAYGPSSFQSTLSMRRATLRRRYVIESLHLFQSTLSMRRATVTLVTCTPIFLFQSTLSMRRRPPCMYHPLRAWIFQSTLSMRRATLSLGIRRETYCISIHALHEESDLWRECRQPHLGISIHALHEESDYQLSAMLPELT